MWSQCGKLDFGGNLDLTERMQMSERLDLNEKLDGETFRSYYYLKKELVDFCRENNLPVSGGKVELTDRIACFLDTGKVLETSAKRKATIDVGLITENTRIESNIVCSEKHRAFFKEKIGKSFSFNVLFQKWLKSNAGKTYGDAIHAYYQILEEKKRVKQRLISNLSIIHTSEISSKIIKEEVWMKLLHVGNIKRVCKDTIVMKSLTLLC